MAPKQKRLNSDLGFDFKSNNMKRTVSLILIIWLCFSCDNENAPDCFKSAGSIVKREVSIPSFSRILVNEGIELIIKQGADYRVEIESGKNLINEIDAKVVNERLILSNNTKCNLFRSYGNTVAYVTVPQLTEIRSSTQFDIRSDGVLDFERLTIISEDYQETSAQSVGDFYLNLRCESFRLVFNNLSNAFIEGNITEASVEFESGNGRFEGENLIIDRVNVFHRGTNDMILNVANSLQGDIFSTGNVISVTRPPEVAVTEHYRGKLIFRD